MKILIKSLLGLFVLFCLYCLFSPLDTWYLQFGAMIGWLIWLTIGLTVFISIVAGSSYGISRFFEWLFTNEN